MTVDRTKFNEIQEIPKGGLLNIQRSNGGVLSFDDVEYVPGPPYPLLVAYRQLTHDEILTMWSQPVPFIPAPGTGKQIIILYAHIWLDQTAALYTANGSGDIYVGFPDNLAFSSSNALVTGNVAAGSLFGDGQPGEGQFIVGAGGSMGKATIRGETCVNKPVIIATDTADPSGGAPGNTLTVKAWYIAIAPGPPTP